MCSYNNLVHSPNGYVIRCEKCQNLHVGFGTTVLAFSNQDFFEFYHTINEQIEEYRNITCTTSKQITIPTALRSISLVYSYNELEQLNILLQAAKEKLKKEALFNFNYN